MDRELPYICEHAQEFPFSAEETVELMQAVFAKDALFRVKVKGTSMCPFVKDQDIVTLSPLRRSAAGFGKLVACVCPTNKKFFIHRVVAKKGSYYLVKGDNCKKPDCFVEEKDIVGCVIHIERENKRVSFSLGPERIMIAVLSRVGLLPGIFFFWNLIPKILRSFIRCRILT